MCYIRGFIPLAAGKAGVNFSPVAILPSSRLYGGELGTYYRLFTFAFTNYKVHYLVTSLKRNGFVNVNAISLNILDDNWWETTAHFHPPF